MKLLLRFNTKVIKEPVIATAILRTKVLINIVRAHVETTSGEVVVDVPNETVDQVFKTFSELGVDVYKLEKPIIRSDEECVHCGACISVCPLKVFSFDKDWTVKLDSSHCVQCGACIPSCPHRALSLSR
jgi:ferredoxin